eukprot:SAG31_NODE_6220_length_2114_cov_1.084367_3_plen_85_part_00
MLYHNISYYRSLHFTVEDRARCRVPEGQTGGWLTLSIGVAHQMICADRTHVTCGGDRAAVHIAMGNSMTLRIFFSGTCQEKIRS